MSKFKTGDSVIFIGLQLIDGLTKGKTYEVLDINPHWDMITVAADLHYPAKYITATASLFMLATLSPFGISTSLRDAQGKMLQAVSMYGTGSMKIEMDQAQESQHSCNNHLNHYTGFLERYKYCTVCDKKFRS